jgi:hypothetical protein
VIDDKDEPFPPLLCLADRFGLALEPQFGDAVIFSRKDEMPVHRSPRVGVDEKGEGSAGKKR